MRVIDAVQSGSIRARTARSWGPALVFGRLWETQKIPQVIEALSADRRFQFDVERAIFAMALQRLCQPGSDLQGSQWVETVEAEGFEHLQLQHFYRTCGFLHDVREDLERKLYCRDRTLFSQELDLVFIDTTSLYAKVDLATLSRVALPWPGRKGVRP